MRLAYFWVFFGLIVLPVYSYAKVSIKTEMLLSSPAIELSDFNSSWAKPDNGRYAQARARIATQFTLGHYWSVGLQKRWDYLLGFNQETAQFYSGLENNHIQDGQYSLDLSVNAARSKSVFVQYFIPLSSSTQVELRAHAIKGGRIQKGRLSGLGYATNNQLGYNWQLDYAYDENRLFESGKYSATGWGHSFDANLTTRLGTLSTVKISLEDLWHHIYWQDLKQDEGCLNRPLTSDCSVSSKQQTYTQILPVFGRITWDYRFLNHYSMLFEYQHWQRFQGVLMGVKAKSWHASYDLTNETYNLGYESTHLTVKWGTDQLNINNAKHWQMTLDMNWPFYDL